MIRFACPACKGHLEVENTFSDQTIACPQCGQRMRVPARAKPAAINPTVSSQLTPSIVPGPAPSASAETDGQARLRLRKDAEQVGGDGEVPGYKPARSWVGTVCALLAVSLAVAAMPAAVIHHPLLGAVLAGLGLLFGALGLLFAVQRRGAGCALSLAGTAV
jgi:hypothetical protein